MTFGKFFSYLRDHHNQPAVAVIMETAYNSSIVNFQLATRNSKDNFDKRKARLMLEGRLAKHPVTIDMGVLNSKQTDILLAIRQHLIDTKYQGVKAGPITRSVIEQRLY